MININHGTRSHNDFTIARIFDRARQLKIPKSVTVVPSSIFVLERVPTVMGPSSSKVTNVRFSVLTAASPPEIRPDTNFRAAQNGTQYSIAPREAQRNCHMSRRCYSSPAVTWSGREILPEFGEPPSPYENSLYACVLDRRDPELRIPRFVPKHSFKKTTRPENRTS